MKRHIFIVLLLTISTLTTWSQQKDKNAEHYIKKYSHIAIGNMKEFGIPASVTMAQGLLESGFGLSELAKKSNNHFGIKCKKEWTGEKVYHDDDEAQECFRKYSCVEDSYTDHAVFLSSSKRYANLFMLPRGDYKAWAKGLKAAGYATNPKYPTLLIGMIELYELDNLDRSPLKPELKTSKIPSVSFKGKGEIAAYIMGGRSVYRSGKNLYIYAQKNDSYDKISKALKLRKKKLERINGRNNPLTEGTRINLKKIK